MTLPDYPRIHFRAADLLPALSERTTPEPDGSLSERGLANTADRDLHRYYHLLRLALPTFSLPEASLIVDALNGLILEPHSGHLLWAEIEDGLAEGLAEKHGVAGLALVARLRALPPFEAFAVAEAAERWWNGPHREADWGASLRAVGLVR